MKKPCCFIIAVLSMFALNISSTLFAAALSSDAKQFLAGYEAVRSALANDDLAAALKAAAPLGESGAAIAKSGTLAEARSAFDKLSADAIKLASGHEGYYVAHCDMVNKDWLQTSRQISNPYVGKEMAGCGEIKK